MRNARRLNPLRELSPGEIAFDWCLFSTVALGFLSAILSAADLAIRSIFHRADWSLWFNLPFGILLAVNWVRTFRGVVDAWFDPAARLLRFSSLALLLGQLVVVATFAISLSSLLSEMTSGQE